MSRINLCEADLNGADLSGANLTKSNLSNANLSAVNLSEANLSEADLDHTNLSEANLEGAEVTSEQLELVKKLEKATMPDGKTYVPPAETKPTGSSKGEKRKATATGLAAVLSRMKGKSD